MRRWRLSLKLMKDLFGAVKPARGSGQSPQEFSGITRVDF